MSDRYDTEPACAICGRPTGLDHRFVRRDPPLPITVNGRPDTLDIAAACRDCHIAIVVGGHADSAGVRYTPRDGRRLVTIYCESQDPDIAPRQDHTADPALRPILMDAVAAGEVVEFDGHGGFPAQPADSRGGLMFTLASPQPTRWLGFTSMPPESDDQTPIASALDLALRCPACRKPLRILHQQPAEH